jgi:N-acetylmuramoyl-L-alanine amidase
VRFRWFVPNLLSILGVLLLTTSAEAARLQFWRFNVSENRLVFTTDDAVQPRAQLLSNPTRLVIDLPSTTLGSQMVNQPIGNVIREVRIAQFDAQTTRIVIELNPGYTLDPQQILVRGATPTQWTVQLPTPQLVSTSPSPAEATPAPTSPPAASTPPVNPTALSSLSGSTSASTAASTQLENVRVTPDGFFVRTSGTPPQINLQRSRDRRQLTIDLDNTLISPQLAERDTTIDRLGVTRLRLTQAQTTPPIARITLDLADANRDWQATASNLGGVVIVPSGRLASREQDRPSEPEASESAPRQPALIQSIELPRGSNQLLIRADRPLEFTSGWDRSTAAYRITIANARLSPQFVRPQLGPGSPLLAVRSRQEGESVIFLIQPAAGIWIGDLSQPSNQLLALTLNRSGQTPPPDQSFTPIPPSGPLPSVRNGRVVVVIDPGHGGSDPGAVGINGIQEANLVLPVGLQVASLLEQQGVQAILTRRDDRDVELEPRVQIAERANADVFVSIHANSINLSRPDINGIETYYYSPGGERLARIIHSNVIAGTGSVDRGVRRARFYVIRNTTMPAVLVEIGFVTGAQDARRLADPTYQSQMALAIARGILQYIQQTLQTNRSAF